MRAAVIFNPTSGRSRGGATARAVERHLLRHGLEVDLRATSAPRDAGHLAQTVEPDIDIVVAVGGDGTINEIINGLARRPVTEAADGEARRPALGIIPAGTVNVLALELAIPFNVERACKVIAAGRKLSLDLGKANERRFILMMGVGIDALTIRNLDPAAKKRFRELAFFSTGVKTGLSRPPTQFLIRVDGEEHRATFVVASNSKYYGGRFGITPEADLTDGLLDFVIFRGTKRSSLAVFWLGVPTSLHLQNPNVVYVQAKRAELLPVGDEEPMWYQTDGELAGRLPTTVEIEHAAVDVLVPLRNRRNWIGIPTTRPEETDQEKE
jgi:diacylglycerol kinase (ATP)